MSDSDTNSHEEGDDGEQGQQSVERRVRTMTTVTPNVPRIDRNVSQTVAHTRQVRLVLSYAYNTKGQGQNQGQCDRKGQGWTGSM